MWQFLIKETVLKYAGEYRKKSYLIGFISD